MTKQLVEKFIETTKHMNNGDYARIAMIESLTDLAYENTGVKQQEYFELRKMVIDSVE